MTQHDKLKDELKTEVETMHAVLAAWFRGDVAADRTYFDTHLTTRFAQNLTIIYPSGALLSRASFLDPVYAAHGSNPPFRVAIRDFQLIAWSDDNKLATACYIEDQFNARNTEPADNARRSTVLFRKPPTSERYQWLHIHETAITA